MAWNVSFHLDESHDGIYYGSAWFSVRVNGRIERKWAHKFSILGCPVVVLTSDKKVKHLDLMNTLWNYYGASDFNIFVKHMMRIRDDAEVVYTSKMHILSKWIQTKHPYKWDALKNISNYNWHQAEIVNVMPLPFSMLFEQWG